MAGMAEYLPVFDELLDDGLPPDTVIIIVEEPDSCYGADQAGAGRKRSRPDTLASRITLEAHSMVLFSLSPFFRTKLKRWSQDEHGSKRQRQQLVITQQQDHQQLEQQQASPACQQRQPAAEGQHQHHHNHGHHHHHQQQQQLQAPPVYQYMLQLLVPPGQLELGRRLITAMYSSSPDLSDLEAPQLMQLVALADCYGVGKVVKAVADHVLSVEPMPLDTAAAVFELPEECLSLPALQVACQAASDKLQQELGDLEVVWGDQSKRNRVMGLPFGALLQLLEDGRTRVASEDTVVVTVLHWLEHGGPLCRWWPLALFNTLRASHCSASVLSHSDLFRLFTKRGLPRAEIEGMCAMSALSSAQLRQDMVRTSFFHRAAWQLPRRPASCLTRLHLDFKVSLAEVAAAAVKAQSSGSSGLFNFGPVWVTHWWHGRRWDLGLHATPEGRCLMWLQCWPHVTCCNLSLLLWTTSGLACGGWVDQQYSWDAYKSGYSGRWVRDLGPGLGGSWAKLRQGLEEKDLIHPGDMLHFTFTVSGVT